MLKDQYASHNVSRSPASDVVTAFEVPSSLSVPTASLAAAERPLSADTVATVPPLQAVSRMATRDITTNKERVLVFIFPFILRFRHQVAATV